MSLPIWFARVGVWMLELGAARFPGALWTGLGPIGGRCHHRNVPRLCGLDGALVVAISRRPGTARAEFATRLGERTSAASAAAVSELFFFQSPIAGFVHGRAGPDDRGRARHHDAFALLAWCEHVRRSCRAGGGAWLIDFRGGGRLPDRAGSSSPRAQHLPASRRPIATPSAPKLSAGRRASKYRQILLWRTENNVGNAAVMGVLPFMRLHVLLSGSSAGADDR